MPLKNLMLIVPLFGVGFMTLLSQQDYLRASHVRPVLVEQVEQGEGVKKVSMHSLDHLCSYEGNEALDSMGWKLTITSGGCTSAPAYDAPSPMPFMKRFSRSPDLNSLPAESWSETPLRKDQVVTLFVPTLAKTPT